MARGLTWIRDNYDTNRSRYIEDSEVTLAQTDYTAQRISMADLFEVLDANANHTLLPAYGTVKVAKGLLVNFSYPTSAEPNKRIAIRAAVQNTGTANGTFRLRVTGGGSTTQTSTFTVSAGGRSPTQTMYIRTPSSGRSASYNLKCVRII